MAEVILKIEDDGEDEDGMAKISMNLEFVGSLQSDEPTTLAQHLALQLLKHASNLAKNKD